MIVDDEESLLQSLNFTLKRNNFSILTYANGSKALKRITDSYRNGEKISLIITDIQLPGLTGLELIDELNRMDIDIPVLVITNYGTRELIIELLRKGCKDYLDKPFSTADLVKRVSTVLEMRKKKQRVTGNSCQSV
jgi:FixJ family two-component response regulator